MGSFGSNLAFGQIAETAISKWFIKRGYLVLPVYEKEIDTGKGPRVFSTEGEYVAPDLFVIKNERQFYWIEAKHKTVFTWHRITGKWTTGIDRNHYHSYS